MKIPDIGLIPNDPQDIDALQTVWKSLKNVDTEIFELTAFQALSKRTFELLYSLHCESNKSGTDTIPKSVAELLIDIAAFSTIAASDKTAFIAQTIANEFVNQTLIGWKTPAKMNHSKILYLDQSDYFSVVFEGNVYNIRTADFDITPIIDGKYDYKL